MASSGPSKKTEKTSEGLVIEIANTLDWLITALILAFVFRAFVMEAFRIPTGSMADTLKGAHFRLRCTQCGYEYDHAFSPEHYGIPQDTVPGYDVRIRPAAPRCPSCGYFLPTDHQVPVANGDRILVLKCIYQLVEPHRWDVIVFKNPTEPRINYIKRLIGLPGEKVEIIDGDIYINGRIAKKPPKVQEELWMPVYDNNYRPVRPEEFGFNGHQWHQVFQNTPGSNWQPDIKTPTTFTLDSPPGEENTLVYDTTLGNDFRATYAYDYTADYKNQPYCSDLMVRLYVTSLEPNGHIGIGLSKYTTLYKARVTFEGQMVISKQDATGNTVELAKKNIGQVRVDRPTLVRFANVDHRLVFQAGDEKLTSDLGTRPDDAGLREKSVEPKTMILGSGKLSLSNVGIFRDIHYTTENAFQRQQLCRAAEGNPLTLAEDEFFVLGDNSSASLDSRWWPGPGKANNAEQYRPGIVPRDYLTGKAIFVYWPSGFRLPWPESLMLYLRDKSRQSPLCRILHAITSFGCVPNVGRIRLIYGGSANQP